MSVYIVIIPTVFIIIAVESIINVLYVVKH